MYVNVLKNNNKERENCIGDACTLQHGELVFDTMTYRTSENEQR